MSSGRPSESTIKSAQRDIERAQSEIARHQKTNASEMQNIARKQTDLARAQKDLMAEQQKETKKSLDEIKKGQEVIRRLESESQNRAFEAVQRVRFPGAFAPLQEDPEVQITSAKKYTAFISHASEDKDEVARPLCEALRSLGHEIWFDEMTIKVGDRLRSTIDKGLSNSTFGIVILSPSFFAKDWPQYEFDGLVALEAGRTKVILPLWHKVTKAEVIGYSPTLGDRVALSTSAYTVEEIAEKIHEVLSEPTPE